MIAPLDVSLILKSSLFQASHLKTVFAADEEFNRFIMVLELNNSGIQRWRWISVLDMRSLIEKAFLYFG